MKSFFSPYKLFRNLPLHLITPEESYSAFPQATCVFAQRERETPVLCLWLWTRMCADLAYGNTKPTINREQFASLPSARGNYL